MLNYGAGNWIRTSVSWLATKNNNQAILYTHGAGTQDRTEDSWLEATNFTIKLCTHFINILFIKFQILYVTTNALEAGIEPAGVFRLTFNSRAHYLSAPLQNYFLATSSKKPFKAFDGIQAKLYNDLEYCFKCQIRRLGNSVLINSLFIYLPFLTGQLGGYRASRYCWRLF